MTLTEFLLARIAEDEAAAKAAASGEGGARWNAYFIPGEGISLTVRNKAPEEWEDVRHDDTTDFIARHDPARVLRECEAKRKIVEWHKPFDYVHPDYLPSCEGCWEDGGEDGPPLWPCRNVRWAALPYSDHPDYNEEWKP